MATATVQKCALRLTFDVYSRSFLYPARKEVTVAPLLKGRTFVCIVRWTIGPSIWLGGLLAWGPSCACGWPFGVVRLSAGCCTVWPFACANAN